MDKSYSLLLDLIRFCAAVAVFFYHAEFDQFKVKWLSPVASFGHDAVLVFFILSGFVISFVATTKETSWQAYSASRLARIISVAFPALLLTALLMLAAEHELINSSKSVIDSDQWKILIHSLIFISQSTFSSSGMLSFNTPFWSINYEVWYYIIFGLAIFTSGSLRIIALAISSVAAGYKIMLLFPIWAMGILLFRIQKIPHKNNIAGLTILIFCGLIYGTLRVLNIDDLILEKTAHYIFGSRSAARDILAFSNQFLRDYFVSLIILAAFYGAYLCRFTFERFLTKNEKIIRTCANSSFTIYLFHWPLLTVFASFSDNSHFILISTIISCYVISVYNNKLWIHLRHLFNSWLMPKTIKGNQDVTH